MCVHIDKYLYTYVYLRVCVVKLHALFYLQILSHNLQKAGTGL